MLADPELEAVSVTTMWDQHTAPTLAALRAGKHVFLEKPMASTVADCRAILEAAKATDKYFMVGHIVRFQPRYAGAKREIDAGKIGKIVSIYARRNIPAALGTAVLPKIGPWFMPDKVPYFPDERMEIVGTEGSIHIQETYPSLLSCVIDKTPPAIITPEESLAATRACLAAEASAATGQVVAVQDFEG